MTAKKLVLRNEMISFLQAVGAILVVAFHLYTPDDKPAGYATFAQSINFHMPLWMFVSGYLAMLKFKRCECGYNSLTISELWSFVRDKACTLLTPYVVIGTLVFPLKSLLSTFAKRPVDLSVGGWLHSLAFPWDSPIIFYWFLPTLFLIFIVAWLALWLTHRSWSIAVLMTVSAPLFVMGWEGTNSSLLNIRGVGAYFIWWGAGFLFCKFQPAFVRSLRLERGWVCLLFLVTFIATDLFWLDVWWLKALVGIPFVISLSFLYTRRGWHFFDHLYGYSYTIYLLSWFVVVPVGIVGMGFVHLPWWAVLPVSTAMALYIPWLIARFVQRRLPNARLLKLLIGVR